MSNEVKPKEELSVRDILLGIPLAITIILLYLYGLPFLFNKVIPSLFDKIGKAISGGLPCTYLEYTTYTDDNLDFSIKIPENWFLETFEPGTFGTGGTPEYLLAISNLEGDNSLQAAAQEETLVRIVLTRNIPNYVDPSGGFSVPIEQVFPDIKIDRDEKKIDLGGVEATLTLVQSNQYSAWFTKELSVVHGGYTYLAVGTTNSRQLQNFFCANVVDTVLKSIRFNKN